MESALSTPVCPEQQPQNLDPRLGTVSWELWKASVGWNIVQAARPESWAPLSSGRPHQLATTGLSLPMSVHYGVQDPELALTWTTSLHVSQPPSRIPHPMARRWLLALTCREDLREKKRSKTFSLPALSILGAVNLPKGSHRTKLSKSTNNQNDSIASPKLIPSLGKKVS